MSIIIGGERMSQFYCREDELRKLNKRYSGDKFECIVIYGRRRVGKTALINEFCKDKPTIFFSALNTTGKENLEAFSKSIMSYERSDMESAPEFRTYDDALDECLRCYNNPKDSYEDHAEFLKKPRYSFLFDYKINDYKSWAKGLKKAGYATDPNYPTKLINIIETYKLYEYDEGGKLLSEVNQSEDNTSKEFTDKIEEINGENDQLFGYQEIKNNGVRCYKLMNDDSYQHIAKVTGISLKMLLYYNDLPKECPLYKDDYVYLAPKKRNAAKKTPKYTVKAGDSMHSISQEYGIKLKSLYKINNIEYGTPAKVGQKLKLRK